MAALKAAVAIDVKNNNGQMIEQEVIERIFAYNLAEEVLIANQHEMTLTEDKLLNWRQYTSLGIINIIFNGSFYTLLDLIIKGILTHNVMIFTDEGYMQGINGLLIEFTGSLLEQLGYDRYQIQICHNIDFEELFASFKTINKTIIIGDSDTQIKHLKDCQTETLVSGYNNFEIYVDDANHLAFIEKIMAQDLKISLYLKDDLGLKFAEAIYVSDIEEAITQINYNGSGYSAAIFATNQDTVTNFISNVKSKNIFVNASPTLTQRLDLNQQDLLYLKEITMPNIYKFTGESTKIAS